MTKAEAKKYSLIKWNYARETGCTGEKLNKHLARKHSEVFNFLNSCGLCEKYLSPSDCREGCKVCSLQKRWKRNCFDSDSLFARWDCCKKILHRKKYAKQIYQDIKRS